MSTEEIFIQIILALIQGATEFLPISSSGHLALVSSFFSYTNVAFFVMLHLGSLVAVLFFTRKEIWQLLHFKKEDRKIILFLMLATIPAAVVGLLFNNFIESQFSSMLFLGFSFIFTGFILFFTKFSEENHKINWWRAITIGFGQAIAVFPGISRSGMTISTASFLGIEKEKAMKFSFLLFIPIVMGATLLEIKTGQFNFSAYVLISFFVSIVSSLI
ncbi:MAG: undecaprenyl-diphosphate phosphatase, partial [archaeon]